MVKRITETSHLFVSFEPSGEQFQGWLHLTEAAQLPANAEVLLRTASQSYAKHLKNMRKLLSEVQERKHRKTTIPATLVWRLGEELFALVRNLNGMSLQISGLYDHLGRDLGVSRKWLEKVVIFRRYIPAVKHIPRKLTWGQCQDGTRRAALGIMSGNHVK